MISVSSMPMKLIVGLGNPGNEYHYTRHNLGWRLVEELAKELQIDFKRERKLKGFIAKGIFQQTSVILFLPDTYMNLSGQAYKACLQFFKLKPDHTLVVVDEAALPFGSLRLRLTGSAGGHNGLKSIEQSIGSREYPRLRLGIGGGNLPGLDKFVLEKFSNAEEDELPLFFERGIHAIHSWLIEADPSIAMNKVNLPSSLNKPVSPSSIS